jgi:tRNA threonylcarbamoyladenosine biosynthesis protein TsaB
MTTRLLAIESATDSLSIALMEGDEVVLCEEAGETRQHASVLLPLIDQAFRDVGWSIGDLDALAVSSGPGSFTSLRIGLATAKGLAFGREIQAIGVSTLEAMAAGVDAAGTGTRKEAIEIVSLLDARRGEWYAGGWRCGSGQSLVPGIVEGLYSPEHLAADVQGEVLLVCPERKGWDTDFKAAGLKIAGIVEGPAARPRADWIGRLGRRGLVQGKGGAPRDLVARYLRRAEAEAKRLGGPVEAGELARVDSDRA